MSPWVFSTTIRSVLPRPRNCFAFAAKFWMYGCLYGSIRS